MRVNSSQKLYTVFLASCATIPTYIDRPRLAIFSSKVRAGTEITFDYSMKADNTNMTTDEYDEDEKKANDQSSETGLHWCIYCVQ